MEGVQKHTRIKAKASAYLLGKLSSSATIAGSGRSDDILEIGKEEKSTNNMAQQNLFIGSLAYATTDDTLKSFFEQIGEVERAMVAKERETGRSRGFGFVTFVDEANNQKAVDLLNGKELDGRAITVTVARPREDKPRRDFGGNNHGGGNGGGNSFRQRSW